MTALSDALAQARDEVVVTLDDDGVLSVTRVRDGLTAVFRPAAEPIYLSKDV